MYLREAFPSFMKQGKFRKLNIELPVEQITKEGPWLIAGWLFAIAFVIIAAFAFLQHKKIF